jgi:phage shock protein PspC (stress-responsive transcriptional regulator)
MAGCASGGRLDAMTTNPDSPALAVAPAATAAEDVDPTPRPDPTALDARPASFRLRRSRTDRMLGGVCGGLAEGLGADAALLRVLLVALTLITGGAAAFVYLAAWVLAPVDEHSAP